MGWSNSSAMASFAALNFADHVTASRGPGHATRVRPDLENVGVLEVGDVMLPGFVLVVSGVELDVHRFFGLGPSPRATHGSCFGFLIVGENRVLWGEFRPINRPLSFRETKTGGERGIRTPDTRLKV